MNDTTTVLLCGVGGQGTILAADLLAKTAAAAGLDVKLSEIHGMSQRGGSVSTIVRFGETVNSMVCDKGEGDVLIAFETTEALRYISGLKKGGTMVVNNSAVPPLTVLSGRAEMPEDASERLSAIGAHLVDATGLAREAGNEKTANVTLIGALSALLEFDPVLWKEVISNRVPPKTVESNLASFDLGRAAVLREA